MSEILFRNFQLLVCCGLLHQLSVTEIYDAFCHSAVTWLYWFGLLFSKVYNSGGWCKIGNRYPLLILFEGKNMKGGREKWENLPGKVIRKIKNSKNKV